MGQINKTWLDDCRANESEDSTVEDWFAQVFNCQTVEIGDDGSLWIESPMAGHWVSQDRINAAFASIEANTH
jgi:hypothetical protein